MDDLRSEQLHSGAERVDPIDDATFAVGETSDVALVFVSPFRPGGDKVAGRGGVGAQYVSGMLPLIVGLFLFPFGLWMYIVASGVNWLRWLLVLCGAIFVLSGIFQVLALFAVRDESASWSREDRKLSFVAYRAAVVRAGWRNALTARMLRVAAGPALVILFVQYYGYLAKGVPLGYMPASATAFVLVLFVPVDLFAEFLLSRGFVHRERHDAHGAKWAIDSIDASDVPHCVYTLGETRGEALVEAIAGEELLGWWGPLWRVRDKNLQKSPRLVLKSPFVPVVDRIAQNSLFVTNDAVYVAAVLPQSLCDIVTFSWGSDLYRQRSNFYVDNKRHLFLEGREFVSGVDDLLSTTPLCDILLQDPRTLRFEKSSVTFDIVDRRVTLICSLGGFVACGGAVGGDTRDADSLENDALVGACGAAHGEVFLESGEKRVLFDVGSTNEAQLLLSFLTLAGVKRSGGEDTRS